MRRSKKLILMLAVIATFITVSFMMLSLALAGDLEPSAGPAPTMHSLEEIYNLIANIGTAQVAKTGQTVSYATGDDGDREKGIDFPVPRFTDNGDGTVTDNLTGLIWLKNANCFDLRSWSDALTDSNNLSQGSCGLIDSSVAGNWRLPNVKELHSLIDFGRYDPALPAGHPFTNVQSSYYWSATTYAHDTNNAWGVSMYNGNVSTNGKPNSGYVWPVRGGN